MKFTEIHFPIISSTNAWAKEHLATFDREALTVVSADEQTHGRGRFGRVWHSPKNCNLYVTYVFFLKTPPEDPLHLTHLLARTTMDVLKEYGIVGQMKWPNDVLVNQKKIAGILCEITPLEQGVGVVLGLGLNINMTQSTGIDQPATSIKIESGKEEEVALIKEKLTSQFGRTVSELIT